MFHKLKVGITSNLKYNVIFTHKLDSVIKPWDFLLLIPYPWKSLGRNSISFLVFFKNLKGARHTAPIQSKQHPPHTHAHNNPHCAMSMLLRKNLSDFCQLLQKSTR